MWIGTSAGLYLLDKESGRFQYVALQEETTYINTLYQAEDLSLYIGTNGSGVVVYNAKDSTFKHYHKDNCALISNNIYTILPESDGHILMSTENGISCFHPTEKTFHNWTKEQGLMSSCSVPLPERYARTRVLSLAAQTEPSSFPKEPFAQVHLLSYDTQRFSDTLSDSLSRQSEFPLEGKHQPDRPVKAEI